MKTNAILLALLIFCMSLAGCISQTDGVAEVTLTDDQVHAIVDEHLEDFLTNVSIVVNEEITNNNQYAAPELNYQAIILDVNQENLTTPFEHNSRTAVTINDAFNTTSGYMYNVHNIALHIESQYENKTTTLGYVDFTSQCGELTDESRYYLTELQSGNFLPITLANFVSMDCTIDVEITGSLWYISGTAIDFYDGISSIYMEIIVEQVAVSINTN